MSPKSFSVDFPCIFQDFWYHAPYNASSLNETERNPTMKKHYYAHVYGPRHELVRYAGAVVEATGPEGASRLKPGDEKRKDGEESCTEVMFSPVTEKT